MDARSIPPGRHTLVIALLAVACSLPPLGCEPPKTASADAKKSPPPAQVSKPAKEDDLGTVTLRPESEKSLGLQTAVVEERAVNRSRTYAGDVIVPPGRLVIVSSPFLGTIQAPKEGAIPTPGVRVKKGQAIVAILPTLSPEAKATMATLLVEAEGQVEQARKQLDVTALALKRADELYRRKDVGVAVLEDARAQHEISQTALRNTQARREILEKTLQAAGAGAANPIPLEAPEDGLLRNTLAMAGQQVAAGAILFEVERLDPVWIRVPVYVGDLPRLAPTEPAEVGGLVDRPGSAKLVAKPAPAPPAADPLTITVDLFYEVANAQHALSPGEKVAVTIPMKDQAKALVVPRSAIYYDRNGGTWVYEQVKDHVFVRRGVDLDHMAGDLAALKQGPKAGSKVVTIGVAELFGTEFGFSK